MTRVRSKKKEPWDFDIFFTQVSQKIRTVLKKIIGLRAKEICIITLYEFDTAIFKNQIPLPPHLEKKLCISGH